MALLTDYQYHENGGISPEQANHGSYQYIGLVDLVRNFQMMYTGNQNDLRNTPRHRIIFEMKQAIKELHMDALKEFKVLQIDVRDDLSMIMPSDYVKYVRISLYENGKLTPLSENPDTNWARAYLKDNNDKIIFDDLGNVIFSNLSQIESDRLAGEDNTGFINSGGIDARNEFHFVTSSRYGMDTSRAAEGPTFSIDRKSGVINFSSDASGKSFVLEYISDGMEKNNNLNIEVNKLFERYVYAKTAYEIANSRMDLQDYKIRKYRNKSRAEYLNASIRNSNFDPVNLLRGLSASNQRLK